MESDSAVQAIATALIGAIIIYVLVFKKARSKLLNSLPAPQGATYFGGHSRLLSVPQRHLVYKSWSQKYDGIYRISLHGQQMVVVSDPALVHAICNSDNIKPRSVYSALDEVIHPQCRPSLFSAPSSDDEAWRRVRSALLHSFSPAELANDFEAIKVLTFNLMVLLDTQLSQGTKRFEMFGWMSRLVLDIVGITKIGIEFQAVETEGEVPLLMLLNECMVEYEARQANPWRKHLLWVSDDAARGRMRYLVLAEFMKELWGEATSGEEPDEDDQSVIAHLMRLRSSLPHDRLLADMGAFLLAGAQPTAAAATWALYLLASTPAAQERLAAELKREGVTDTPDSLTMEKLGQLTFLQCVVKEALRLMPPAALGTVRETSTPVKVGPHTLPARTPIVVDVYSMHTSSKYWKDADKFIPERWETSSCTGDMDTTEAKDGDTSPALPDDAPFCNPGAYLPFSGGSRSCLGQRSARLQVSVIVGLFISQFVVECVKGSDDTYEAHLGLNLVPGKNGMPLILRPRP